MKKHHLYVAFLFLPALIWGMDNEIFKQIAALPATVEEGTLVCKNQYQLDSNSNSLVIKSTPQVTMPQGQNEVDQIVSVIQVYSMNDLLVSHNVQRGQNTSSIDNVLIISPIPEDTVKIRTFGFFTDLPDGPSCGTKVLFSTTKLYESSFPSKK
ncbi:hypothetical protein JW935_04015 [candidate division KSB1 bacterium]|nr:hypothetical protein [candidate division KSB1 bacterium]